MEIPRYGDIEIQNRDTEIWRYRDTEIWRYRDIDPYLTLRPDIDPFLTLRPDIDPFLTLRPRHSYLGE